MVTPLRFAALCFLLFGLGACCHDPGSKVDSISDGYTIKILRDDWPPRIQFHSRVLPGQSRDDSVYVGCYQGSTTIRRVNPTTGESAVLRADLFPGLSAFHATAGAWAMVQQGKVTVSDDSGKVLWDHVAGPAVTDVFLAADTRSVTLAGVYEPTDNLGLALSGVRSHDSGRCAILNSAGEMSPLLKTDAPGEVFSSETVVCVLPTQIQIADPTGQHPQTRGYVGDASTRVIAAERDRNMLILRRQAPGFFCFGARTLERRQVEKPGELVWQVPQTLLASGYITGNEIISCRVSRSGRYIAYVATCSIGAIDLDDPSRRVEVRLKENQHFGQIVELESDRFAIMNGLLATMFFQVERNPLVAAPPAGN
ncbi:MAG: hypothetical protein J0L78_13985 [Planctomycetes bacterium]|nr:hypothetical protein [Planctomycetota bacterium]